MVLKGSWRLLIGLFITLFFAWAALPVLHSHFDAILQFFKALHSDRLPRLQARHCGCIAVGCAGGNRLDAGSLVGLDYINKRPLSVALDRRGGNQCGVMLRVHEEL